MTFRQLDSRTLRAFGALVYSAVMGVLYSINETSAYFAAPYAHLTWLLIHPFMGGVYLTGPVILVLGVQDVYEVRFEDVCTGLLLVGLVSVFLLVKSSSWLTIAGVAGSLYALNTFRVILVIFILRYGSFEAASLIHDAFYVLFTVTAIFLCAYGALPLFMEKKR